MGLELAAEFSRNVRFEVSVSFKKFSMMKVLIVFSAIVCSVFADTQIFHNPSNGKTYIYDDSPYNYHTSLAFCARQNATLVKIESQMEWDWIQENVRIRDWVILNILPQPKGVHPTHWADGTAIAWFNWGSRRPQLIKDDTFFWTNSAGEWSNARNFDMSDIGYHVLCEQPRITPRTELDQLNNTIVRHTELAAGHDELTEKSQQIAKLVRTVGSNLSEQMDSIVEKMEMYNTICNMTQQHIIETENLRGQLQQALATIEQLRNESNANTFEAGQLQQALGTIERLRNESDAKTTRIAQLELLNQQQNTTILDKNTEVQLLTSKVHRKEGLYSLFCKEGGLMTCPIQKCGPCSDVLRATFDEQLNSVNELICCEQSCACEAI